MLSVNAKRPCALLGCIPDPEDGKDMEPCSWRFWKKSTFAIDEENRRAAVGEIK
jgi:hypothetical protein